jgi:hypothetical protein
MGLDEVTSRLDRAQKHLDALNAGIDAYASRQPYAFHVVTYYGNEIRDIEWIRLPPPKWSLLVGDCAHNVRCALDHIVYEMSGGRNGIVPRYAEFPIFNRQPPYFLRTKKGNPAHGSGLRKIEGVKDLNARTAIRNLQPFRRQDPERHPLWILHELNNFDKHRAMPFMFAAIRTNLAAWGVREIEDLPPGWRQARATQSTKYVTHLPPGTAVPNVKVRFDLAMRVTLRPKTAGSHESIDVILREIIDYVRNDAVHALRQWIPRFTADYREPA